jgi:hypothetical protein
MTKRLRQMPRDFNQLAKTVVDLATEQIKPEARLEKHWSDATGLYSPHRADLSM